MVPVPSPRVMATYSTSMAAAVERTDLLLGGAVIRRRRGWPRRVGLRQPGCVRRRRGHVTLQTAGSVGEHERGVGLDPAGRDGGVPGQQLRQRHPSCLLR